MISGSARERRAIDPSHWVEKIQAGSISRTPGVGKGKGTKQPPRKALMCIMSFPRGTWTQPWESRTKHATKTRENFLFSTQNFTSEIEISCSYWKFLIFHIQSELKSLYWERETIFEVTLNFTGMNFVSQIKLYISQINLQIFLLRVQRFLFLTLAIAWLTSTLPGE